MRDAVVPCLVAPAVELVVAAGAVAPLRIDLFDDIGRGHGADVRLGSILLILMGANRAVVA